MVGLSLAVPCSQHISFFLLRFMEWVSGGGTAGGGGKENENAFNLSSHQQVGFSRMGYVQSISLFLKDPPLYTEQRGPVLHSDV